MSRVDHWRIHKIHNSNRMKSGTLGNESRNVSKIMDGYFHKSKYSDDLGILKKIDVVVKQLKYCYGIVRSTSVDYAEGLKDAYERAIGIVKEKQ